MFRHPSCRSNAQATRFRFVFDLYGHCGGPFGDHAESMYRSFCTSPTTMQLSVGCALSLLAIKLPSYYITPSTARIIRSSPTKQHGGRQIWGLNNIVSSGNLAPPPKPSTLKSKALNVALFWQERHMPCDIVRATSLKRATSGLGPEFSGVWGM